MVRIEEKKRLVCILVKAYPLPSTKYEETVCCAGVTDTGDLIRLYPVPFRRLEKEQQFKRYDWIEAESWRTPADFRPESYQLLPTSVRVVKAGSSMKDVEKVELWKPFIADSLVSLRQENKQSERSLGIIKPEFQSVRFIAKPIKQDSEDDQALTQSMYKQASLLDDTPLPELEKPAYSFYYNFDCGGYSHKMKIHDWEVAAAYYRFKRQYGESVLDKMKTVYEQEIPQQNLHLIMGTMQAHPRQFIIIGLLRSKVDPKTIGEQKRLF